MFEISIKKVKKIVINVTLVTAIISNLRLNEVGDLCLKK